MPEKPIRKVRGGSGVEGPVAESFLHPARPRYTVSRRRADRLIDRVGSAETLERDRAWNKITTSRLRFKQARKASPLRPYFTTTSFLTPAKPSGCFAPLSSPLATC